MTIESNFANAIATLKKLAPILQPTRSKTKTYHSLYARFFPRAFSKLLVIARNSDWFVALLAPVVIGRSSYCGFGFSTVI